MRRRRWLAIGLGVYGIALLVMAPATLLDARLRDASAGRLRLAEAEGTLWSGSALLELRDADGRAGLAMPLVWRFRPSALLRARLGYDVVLEQAAKPIPVAIAWSRIEITDADIQFPAAALGYLAPTLAPLGLTGDMHLLVPKLSMSRTATRGSATLQWRAAASALSPVSPLGEYALQMQGEGTVVRATLSTLQGPLQLRGQGAWGDGRKPVFLATAQMPPEIAPKLAPFLRLIAVEQGDGSFQWQLK